MELVFKTSLLHFRIPVFYDVFKTSPNEYLAVPGASAMKAFVLTKEAGEWKSNEDKLSNHAKEIARLVDMYYADTTEDLPEYKGSTN